RAEREAILHRYPAPPRCYGRALRQPDVAALATRADRRACRLCALRRAPTARVGGRPDRHRDHARAARLRDRWGRATPVRDRSAGVVSRASHPARELPHADLWPLVRSRRARDLRLRGGGDRDWPCTAPAVIGVGG